MKKNEKGRKRRKRYEAKIGFCLNLKPHELTMDSCLLSKGEDGGQKKAAYMKVGGWLHKKPCKDCAEREENGRERVLDVSMLLNLKGSKDVVGYYCNSGPVGHSMGEEEEWRHRWTCDMVLCKDCFSERETTLGDCKRTRRSRLSLK